jgi:hypothetical protein
VKPLAVVEVGAKPLRKEHCPKSDCVVLIAWWSGSCVGVGGPGFGTSRTSRDVSGLDLHSSFGLRVDRLLIFILIKFEHGGNEADA